MNWNKRVRQIHRWVCMASTVAVIACFVALGFGEPPEWLFFLPLPPLFVLLFTGLYMFVLPYAKRRGSGRPA